VTWISLSVAHSPSYFTASAQFFRKRCSTPVPSLLNSMKDMAAVWYKARSWTLETCNLWWLHCNFDWS